MVKEKQKYISVYDLFTKFQYKKFIKQQIIYMFNPYKHFKEGLLGIYKNEEDKK